MLRRFASATTVAAVLLGCAAVIVYFVPGIHRDRTFAILLFWLCIPAIWGIWCVLAPAAWTPQHLPAWGAILGLFAGVGAFLVLNAPYRFLDLNVSVPRRSIGAIGIAAFYSIFWMLVRKVLMSLTTTPVQATPRRAGAHAA